MKKILGIIACFLFTTSSWGQGFSKAEYFFDADPGINNGTSINLSSATDTFNFTTTASTISLSAGFHFLGLRVLHNDGVWSMFETRKFYITSPATTDVTDVVAAEYFFDTDPGPGNGFSLSVGATGGIVNFTAAIPTSFTSGFHWLAIRTKDAEGKWSMFETRKFYISPPVTNDVTDVVAAEYFLDTDPGVGNGSPLSVGATGGIVNFVAAIPTSYTTGFHLLAIRTKDAEGKWGLFESRRFYIIQPSEDMPVITAAEYFFDTDPGPGNAYPLAVPAAGNNVILSSTILAPCLPIGQHFVGLRVRDQLNQWGLFGHDTISIVAGVAASVVTPAGPLTFCEPDSMLLSTPAAQGVTYQWLKNGAVIPGATTTTYYVLATGNYAVQAFCNASTAISNVVSVTVYVPPVITFCPPEVNANNTIGQCGQIITYPNAIASGNPVPVITYSQNSGTFFPVDTTTVMVIATNLCSSDTCTFLVIVKDNESPVPDLATLPDVTGQCSATATAPSATDNCAGSVIGTTSDSTSYSTQGTRTITWTYNDGKGNTSTQSQTVIVHDTQNPVILGCPANIITNPNPGSCTKVVTWTAPTATDSTHRG